MRDGTSVYDSPEWTPWVRREPTCAGLAHRWQFESRENPQSQAPEIRQYFRSLIFLPTNRLKEFLALTGDPRLSVMLETQSCERCEAIRRRPVMHSSTFGVRFMRDVPWRFRSWKGRPENLPPGPLDFSLLKDLKEVPS